MAYQVQASLPGLDPGRASPDWGISHCDGFLSDPGQWFGYFETGLDWNRRMKSRYTHTFGYAYDPGHGIRHVSRIPPYLRPLMERVDRTFGFMPNNCLVNYYPDGEHYIGFHSDQGEEMKTGTGVAILSLGSVRTLVMRRTEEPDTRFHYPLRPGSAFHMKDELQETWQHGIPKEAGKGPRISLSFRLLSR